MQKNQQVLYKSVKHLLFASVMQSGVQETVTFQA